MPTGTAGAVDNVAIDYLNIRGDGDAFGSGDFAMRLLQNNGDINKLRTLAVLRENEWREYDQAVVQIAKDTFSIVPDMMAAGMRRPLNNPLAVTQMVWDRVGDMNDAQVDMTAEAVDIRDRLEYNQDTMPIPIIHTGFRLNIRHLLASRANGQGADVTHAQVATTKVVEMIEKLVLYGDFGAGTYGKVYGLTKYPYRITGNLTAAWSGATGAQIFTDLNAMVAALEAKAQFGPYGVYVGRNYMPKLRTDYSVAGASIKTIMQRLMEIESIKYIKPNRFMPANAVVVLNLNSQTAEILDGFQPRMIEWSTAGGMVFLYKIIAIMVPRLRRDNLDQSGIAHYIP